MASEPGEVVGNLVAEWLRRAQADMSVASLTDDERIAPEIVAFHAQQAPVSRQEAREAATLAGRVVAWGLAQIPADVKER